MIVEMHDRLAELERLVARLLRIGVIDSIDKDAGTVRVKLPSGLVLVPMRWAALSGSVWAPPEPGEQALVIAPNGVDSLAVALVGIGTGSGKGDKYVIGAGTTNPAAKANLVGDQLTTLKNAISSAGTVPNDGGAAFKAAIVASLGSWPGSVAASKTEVE